jgi:hypothetical protein
MSSGEQVDVERDLRAVGVATVIVVAGVVDDLGGAGLLGDGRVVVVVLEVIAPDPGICRGRWG